MASRVSVTAASNAGRDVIRVKIFSVKIRPTAAAVSESIWVSTSWRTVDARAHPTSQAEPGLRTAGVGTSNAFACFGTNRSHETGNCLDGSRPER